LFSSSSCFLLLLLRLIALLLVIIIFISAEYSPWLIHIHSTAAIIPSYSQGENARELRARIQSMLSSVKTNNSDCSAIYKLHLYTYFV
jgi:hypothetical protein